MANIHRPSWPVRLDMHGKCLIFLARGTGPETKKNYVRHFKYFMKVIGLNDDPKCWLHESRY